MDASADELARLERLARANNWPGMHGGKEQAETEVHAVRSSSADLEEALRAAAGADAPALQLSQYW